MNQFSVPEFPTIIDSTIMSSFRSCPFKAYLMYLHHWKPKTESVDLHAGAAFANAVEAVRKAYFIQKMDRRSAELEGLRVMIDSYGNFSPPPESPKTFERMCGALEFYFSEYPLDYDGSVPLQFGQDNTGIEFSFIYPLEINHPVTGEPLLYTGRMDMLAQFAGGIYVFDEKTTTRLGQTWARQWEHRSQFTSYCWGAQQYGIETAGVIIRGVSILKTKYETQQVLTTRAPWEIERWYEQVHRDLERMIENWKENRWDFNLDHSCAEYRGCLFFNVCKMQNPREWLQMFCQQQVWSPTDRRSYSLEEYEVKKRAESSGIIME